MNPDEDPDSSEDLNHLSNLSIFHYVLGGLTALFSCFPFIHVFIGLAIVTGKFAGSGKDDPPPEFGWIFVIAGLIFIFLGWALAIAIICAGKNLKRRTKRTFCTVVAAVECIIVPFGTILGTLTLVALNKESTRRLFKS